MAYCIDLALEVVLDCLTLHRSFHYPSFPSQQELLRVDYWNHIKDAAYLISKLLKLNHFEALNVIKYLEMSADHS